MLLPLPLTFPFITVSPRVKEASFQSVLLEIILPSTVLISSTGKECVGSQEALLK